MLSLRRRALIGLGALVASGVVACPARADDADPPPPTAGRRALNLGAAIVPGVAIHGAGQAAAGQWKTGIGLLGMELAGIGVGGAGALAFWYSGASRQIVGTATAMTVLGLSAFGISFLADLYGVLAPPGGTGAPDRQTPLLESSAGVRYIHDPRFAYRALAGAEIDLRLRAIAIEASAWTALGAHNQRLQGVIGYRLFGPRPGQPEAVDGSFLDLSVAATHHAFETEGFALTEGEGFILGRLDLRRIGPSLSGSFAELGVGWAMGAYTYAHAGGDPSALLLARAAFGVYIGAPGRPHGEVAAFLDHRHDDYAGGLLMRGVVSGVFGHAGLEGICYLTDRVGIGAEFQVGSAALVGISLRYRVPGGGVK